MDKGEVMYPDGCSLDPWCLFWCFLFILLFTTAWAYERFILGIKPIRPVLLGAKYFEDEIQRLRAKAAATSKTTVEVTVYPLGKNSVSFIKISAMGQSYAEAYSYLDKIREYIMSGLPEIR
jgi:hypothetical protein